MAFCAVAVKSGQRPAITVQNIAIDVTIHILATLTQCYRIFLPMRNPYHGELREPIAYPIKMAMHSRALLKQQTIPTYHFFK